MFGKDLEFKRRTSSGTQTQSLLTKSLLNSPPRATLSVANVETVAERAIGPDAQKESVVNQIRSIRIPQDNLGKEILDLCVMTLNSRSFAQADDKKYVELGRLSQEVIRLQKALDTYKESGDKTEAASLIATLEMELENLKRAIHLAK